MLERMRSLLAAWCLVSCCSGTTTPPSKKPNVVFALIDDWGSYDAAWRQKELGRSPDLKTPTLDSLSAQSVKLDNYYGGQRSTDQSVFSISVLNQCSQSLLSISVLNHCSHSLLSFTALGGFQSSIFALPPDRP